MTEKAALIELLRDQIKNTRWKLAPPRALRSILAKLEPPPSWPVPYRDP
jgi:hypothetical protein